MSSNSVIEVCDQDAARLHVRCRKCIERTVAGKMCSCWEKESCTWKKVKIEGQESEAAVCQQPIQSSPACLCWRYLHRFCWWYNSAYILHSSLPLLQAVFNTAQDTLCQPKHVLNADKTKFRLFTNSQTGQKRKSDMRNHTSVAVSNALLFIGHASAPWLGLRIHVLSN